MSESYLIGTVTDCKGLKVEVYATSVDGGVKIDVKVASGKADLRGFFMDVGDSTTGVSVDGGKTSKVKNEGVTSVGSRDNNMNGTGEKFDIGVEFGSAGKGKGKCGGDDDIDQASFIVKGISLDDLDGLKFGIRATSVGYHRDDSVKLVGVMDVPDQPPPPVGDEHFPFFDSSDISQLIFYFDTDTGDSNNDGVYTVKIDTPDYFDHDLDNSLDIIMAYLVVNDINITDPSQLLGVSIKSGTVDDGYTTNYYAIDGNEDVDTAPTGSLVVPENVEATYLHDDIFQIIPA